MDVVHVAPRLRESIKKIQKAYGTTFETLYNIFFNGNYDLFDLKCLNRKFITNSSDLLLDNIPPKIELITSATPSQLKDLFAVRLTKDDSYKIEIIPANDTDDSAKFATVWERDAYDRLFTVDAMFLDFNGKVYDYFNGYNDIVNSTVRVAGDPYIRFKEDCMRILKYFRVFTLISNENSVIDQDTMNAIKANISELDKIKGEQIWNEMRMILIQPMGVNTLEKFIECLGLPDNVNFDVLRDSIQKREATRKRAVTKKPQIQQLLGISYLCTLLQTQADVAKLHERLRLSAYERDLAKFLVKYKEKTKNIDDFMYYKQLCLLPLGANRHISKEYVLELLNYNQKQDLSNKLRKTVLHPFPINERILRPQICS